MRSYSLCSTGSAADEPNCLPIREAQGAGGFCAKDQDEPSDVGLADSVVARGHVLAPVFGKQMGDEASGLAPAALNCKNVRKGTHCVSFMENNDKSDRPL